MQRPDRTDEQDPFAILGVARGCSQDDLARAYRALARRYHPDVNQDADAAPRMREINAAFERARRELAVGQLAIRPIPRAAATIIHWPDRAPIRRKARWQQTRWWAAGSGAVLLVAAALVWAVAGHVGSPRPTAGTPSAALAAGEQGSLTWPTLGHVLLKQRKLTAIAAGLYPRDRLQWSGDGRYAALWVDDSPTARSQPQILLFKATDFTPLAQLPGFAAGWSPTADQLALLTSATPNAVPALVVMDMATGAQSTLVRSAGTHMAWSPDGSMIAFSAQVQHVVATITIASGQEQTIYTAPHGDTIVPVGWLDRATILCLLSASKDTRLVALPLGAAGTTQIADLGISPITPVIHPPTSQLLYVTQTAAHAHAQLMLTSGGGQTATLVDARGGFSTIGGWSEDGRWLAYATENAAT